MRGPTLLLLLLLALPGGLRAQRLAPDPFPSVVDAPDTPVLNPSSRVVGTHPGLLALGGVLGGAVGLVGGAYVGARITEDDCEDCFLLGGIRGAIAGGSAGIPLGVHLANGRRGKLLPSLLASLAIGGAGLGAAVLANKYELMIPVPVAQLVASILIERSTSEPPVP
jgi:hypothetical protein